MSISSANLLMKSLFNNLCVLHNYAVSRCCYLLKYNYSLLPMWLFSKHFLKTVLRSWQSESARLCWNQPQYHCFFLGIRFHSHVTSARCLCQFSAAAWPPHLGRHTWHCQAELLACNWCWLRSSHNSRECLKIPALEVQWIVGKLRQEDYMRNKSLSQPSSTQHTHMSALRRAHTHTHTRTCTHEHAHTHTHTLLS